MPSISVWPSVYLNQSKDSIFEKISFMVFISHGQLLFYLLNFISTTEKKHSIRSSETHSKQTEKKNHEENSSLAITFFFFFVAFCSPKKKNEAYFFRYTKYIREQKRKYASISS